MGRQNERLNGLKMIANGASYTLKSSNNLVNNVVAAINDKTGEKSHEKLSSVLYHMDPCSMDIDPMLIHLADFDLAQQKLDDAHKELAQLVCDNKSFDFFKNISRFNEVIHETTKLTEMIKETIQASKDDMAESIKDIPPSLNVKGNELGQGIIIEITGLDINETLHFPALNDFPNHYNGEDILEMALEKVKPMTLQAINKAGRVIIDGHEVYIKTSPAPGMS